MSCQARVTGQAAPQRGQHTVYPDCLAKSVDDWTFLDGLHSVRAMEPNSSQDVPLQAAVCAFKS